MSRTFRLTESAQRDVEDVFERIAADDFATALRIEEELFDTFALLASRPLIGHVREELGIVDPHRAWPVYSYLIIYRPETTPLEIDRVWHSAQRIPTF